MNVGSYIRKPFPVEGIRVTASNMEKVSEWCGGKLKEQAATGNKPAAKYIEINVLRPMNAKQSMAFVGNWVLKVGTNYKIYTDTAFHNTFEPAS